jgi:hypothetical protein
LFSLPFFSRQTTFAVYLLTFIGMLVYSFTLNLGHMWVVFLTAAILGYVLMNTMVTASGCFYWSTGM